MTTSSPAPVTQETAVAPFDPAASRVYRAAALAYRGVCRTMAGRVAYEGLGHVPAPGGGLIVAVNHTSYADPLAVGPMLLAHGHHPLYLAKAELFSVPVLGTILRHTGQVPVHRGTTRGAEALVAAESALQAGGCVVIYPEGTLTRDPQGWPMRGRTGVARLALTAHVPVLPVGVWGTRDWWGPSGHHLRPPRPLRASIGPLVHLDDLRGRPLEVATLAEATERVMAAITLQVAQLRGRSGPATRHDPRPPSSPEAR